MSHDIRRRGHTRRRAHRQAVLVEQHSAALAACTAELAEQRRVFAAGVDQLAASARALRHAVAERLGAAGEAPADRTERMLARLKARLAEACEDRPPLVVVEGTARRRTAPRGRLRPVTEAGELR